ncbi:MAG: protein kinase, partial [Thermostichales cyanobacterium HHBFW_bins_127]
ASQPPAPAKTPSQPKPTTKILFRGRYISKATPVQPASPPPQDDRYRSFFENASDGLFQMDEEGRYLSANPALAKLYGYDTPEELIRTLSQIGLQAYAEPQRRLEFFQQLRQQPSVPPYEGRIYRRDGSTTWIRETLRAVRDPQGSLLYYEGTVQEVAPTNADRTPLLGGRYRLLNPLGSGGFGQTYLAEDMHRPKNPLCVVKRLHTDSNDPRFLATSQKLFNAEAEILERIGRHPQIPQLLAYFCEEQNFYLVQELIEGHSLDQEIKLGQKMPEAQVVSILKEILTILEFVHENKVIHRDIKPTNIIRRKQDGKLVLIDFGAVKEIGSGLSSGGKSSALMAVGTQGYMPIEQCAGRPRYNSDLYAVGILGIEALTGVAAETLQTDPETGELHWHHLATISEGLRAILDKLVRYHFASRYQTATEVLHDLNQLQLN